MLLDILQIKKNPSAKMQFSSEFKPDDSILYDRLAYYNAPGKLEGEYFYQDGSVFLKAELTVTILFSCDKCLKPVEYGLKVKIDEVFSKDSENCEFTYEGDTIVLDKLLHDEILLNLPSVVICGKDCKGLCHTCGTSLNIATCSCSTKVEEIKKNPFESLQNLL